MEGALQYYHIIDIMGSPLVHVIRVKHRDLKLNLPGGRWRQSLGEAGQHQVFRKKSSDKNIPMLSNIFIFILRRGPNYHRERREFETLGVALDLYF